VTGAAKRAVDPKTPVFRVAAVFCGLVFLLAFSIPAEASDWAWPSWKSIGLAEYALTPYQDIRLPATWCSFVVLWSQPSLPELQYLRVPVERPPPKG
jgi:hypothetical protein